MNIATFQSLAERYASVIGREDKVRLTFGGDTAFTDGWNVNLPALPAGTVMTQHEWKVFNGYLDHETAHVRFTDFTQLPPYKTFLSDPVSHHIWNVIEDIRIEKKQIDMYPGSEHYLDTLAMEVDTAKKSRDTEELPQTKSRKLLSLMYKELWQTYRGVTHVMPIEGSLALEGKLGKDIDDLLKVNMPRLTSEVDAVKLAKKIRALLDDEVKKDQAQENRIMSKVMQGLGLGKGKPEKGKGDQPSNSQPEDGSGSGGSMSDEELKAAAQIENGIRERVSAFQQVMEAIAKENDMGVGGKVDPKDRKGHRVQYTWEGRSILPPASTENDRIFVPSKQDPQTYLREKQRLSSEITSVKKMARIYMQSRQRAAWSKGLEEGDLDTDSLSDLFAGNKNIYKELRHRRIIDTAVLVLVDLSGSMDSQIVRQSAILLAEALAPIQELKLAIAGFVGTGQHPSRYKYGQDVRKQFKGSGRLESIDILQFKGFDEPYAKCTGRLGAIKTSGSTPLGDAYGHGFAHLVTRKEKRKILWVVSDGDPAISVADHDHNEYLLMKSVQKKCTRNGVEVWGLGIGSGLKLKDYVDRYAEIQQCSQLPATVLNSVREVAR